MKKLVALIVFVIVACVIVFGICPAVLDIANISPKTDGEVLVTIPEGTSTLGIGALLQRNGLVRSKFAFLVKAKSGIYNGKLSSGTYTFESGMSMTEIMRRLSEPKTVLETITVTFPEGYSLEQMASLLQQKGVTSSEDFLSAMDDSYDFDFIAHIPEGEYKYALQGFLFPSTYEFYKNSSGHDAAERMLSAFSDVYIKEAGSFDNVFEVITKASLIEKEARLESERPIIAGVIENRIDKNMPFQIDASVLYAATDGMFDREESGFIADNIRKLDNPYNTYMHYGLPAGPICNPGLTSIRAALNPQRHSYLYYHTDTDKNDGSHIFTETFREHINTMN